MTKGKAVPQRDVGQKTDIKRQTGKAAHADWSVPYTAPLSLSLILLL